MGDEAVEPTDLHGMRFPYCSELSNLLICLQGPKEDANYMVAESCLRCALAMLAASELSGISVLVD